MIITVKSSRLKIRLLASYLLIGFLNLVMIAAYIYIESRSTLIQRGNQHMASVKSLASQKIKLQLSFIKSQTRIHPELLLKNPDLILNCKYSTHLKNSSRPFACPDLNEIKSFKEDQFYHWGTSSFAIVTNWDHQLNLWIFSHEIFNKILHQRAGLGHSGEVYLVGQDNKIKSALRFVNNWENISINNDSIRLAKTNKDGEVITRDYRNIEVISSYAPLNFDDLSFIILSEIDLSEVIKPLNNTFYNLILVIFILGMITLFLAIFSTKGILKKVSLMNNEINKLYLDREEIQKDSTIKIMAIQEDEREKIAYNLHDSVGQYLTALKWGLSHLMLNLKDNPLHKKVQELSDICDNIILEIRSISQDIMPSLIRDFGCFKAIKEYLTAQKKIYDVEIHFDQSGDLENLNLKKDFQINLYRMIQELVQNTIKHSHSKTIDVKFNLSDEMLKLHYADDGIGMGNNMGFPKSISYRAQLFNGKMERINRPTGLAYNIIFKLSDVKNEKN